MNLVGLIGKMVIKAKYKYCSMTFNSRLAAKWENDCKYLPLTPDHKELYTNIHKISLRRLGEFPDLINCRDYNDKIKWLELFDNKRIIIDCSDKLLVREYVKNKIGSSYLVRLYQVHERFEDIDFNMLPDRFVIKTNHDSGTVILVKDKAVFDTESAKTKINTSLSRSYGWDKGEWAYSFINRRVFVEEFIGQPEVTPPPDYKFHCVDGKVKFCQYIFDRGCNTKEIIVDTNGVPYNFVLFEDFRRSDKFIVPSKWSEMLSVAEILSCGFRYVRVDLYCIEERVYVGEMTFYPKFGCYTGYGQKKLGQLLDFDRSTYEPCLLSELKLLKVDRD